MIEFQNVSRKRRKFLLDSVEFKLPAGCMLGVTGKNGAGKTTLLSCLLDEKSKYKGEILYKGKSIRENHEAFLQEAGYISEDNSFFMNETGKRNGRLLGVFYDMWDQDLFEQLIQKFQVPTGRRLDCMSRGELMKFQLAFAIAHGTKCFLIDEATAGMDPIFRKEFYQILREEGDEDAVAIVTSHIQSDIEKYMDYIGVMEQGKLVSFEENLQ